MDDIIGQDDNNLTKVYIILFGLKQKCLMSQVELAGLCFVFVMMTRGLYWFGYDDLLLLIFI